MHVWIVNDAQTERKEALARCSRSHVSNSMTSGRLRSVRTWRRCAGVSALSQQVGPRSQSLTCLWRS